MWRKRDILDWLEGEGSGGTGGEGVKRVEGTKKEYTEGYRMGHLAYGSFKSTGNTEDSKLHYIKNPSS